MISNDFYIFSMEKKQKSFGLGTKPKRKISLRGASSEPKNLIVDTPPIDLDKHQVSIPKSKMSVKTKSIFPEPTTLEPTQRPPKKKLQKANLENSEIDEPKEKKKKHSSDIIKTKKGHDATQMKKKKTHDLLADIQKKKKKENELITELHNLKAELGIVGYSIQ